MVKIKFMPGIESISGTMKGRNGHRIEFRHFKNDKKGNGHMYFRKDDDYKRAKTTPKEREARSKFALIMRQFYSLSPEEMNEYKKQFEASKGKIKGKRYKSLRGFVVKKLYLMAEG